MTNITTYQNAFKAWTVRVEFKDGVQHWGPFKSQAIAASWANMAQRNYANIEKFCYA
jgi:hypothetical protein